MIGTIISSIFLFIYLFIYLSFVYIYIYIFNIHTHFAGIHIYTNKIYVIREHFAILIFNKYLTFEQALPWQER